MQIHPTSLKEIAALIHAEYIGNDHHMITGFNEIHRVTAGDVVFVDHPKYYDKALNSAATTIIINKPVECPEGKALIIHNEPFTAFNQLTQHFHPKHYSLQPISATAKIGKNTVIMPGCFIGNHVVIGDNCILHPNVIVYDHCQIGNNVIIQAGTVVGSDAFYFKNRKTHFEQLETCGNVIIQDYVRIGANCTFDKGVTSDTIIGKGTIIDNLVHVAHDVVIGEMCLFAANVAIAGCCTIGNNVTMWGQVGVSSDITIGDGAVVQAQSGVGENIPAGKIFFGSPASEARAKMREVFALKQLPSLIHKLYDKS
ncbi:MAG: UDP-3-O-(3-hydroxymyristoyl)glucosamine N-acyltransferase [Bacteroidetes bacterium]|nr:UDP-3-O-(3-hydroxymyristoyl)glucosamine N-acyltransferase [Bacteroidota bacterium]